MTDPLVLGAAAVGIILVLVLLVRTVRSRIGTSKAQRKRDHAHRQAQKRDPGDAAQKGKTYELVIKETQYDRVPPEVRGTINGLQTFVKEIPDPDSSDALDVGETIRVQVTDYGTKGTTAEARFLSRD